MTDDLIGELRQLAHDLVTVSPQASAIKGKHPRILDEAAKKLVAGDAYRSLCMEMASFCARLDGWEGVDERCLKTALDLLDKYQKVRRTHG